MNGNAVTLLPRELLLEVQRYIQGKSIYIPKDKDCYKKWGDNTRSKELTARRNEEIRLAYQGGAAMEELSGRYGLSLESIRKIVYKK